MKALAVAALSCRLYAGPPSRLDVNCAEWDDLTIRLLECLLTITIYSFQHYSYVTANYMYVNYVMFRYPYT